MVANIIDSGVIFKFGDKIIVNANDNKPSTDLCKYIIEKYGSVDVALIPAGGGSGYPSNYENLEIAEKEKLADRKAERQVYRKKKKGNDHRRQIRKREENIPQRVTDFEDNMPPSCRRRAVHKMSSEAPAVCMTCTAGVPPIMCLDARPSA